MEVFDESGDGLVVGRDPPARVVEDVAVYGVAVPVVGAVFWDAFGGEGLFPDHGDEAASGFDEAPCHEAALSVGVHAVAFSDGGGFFGEVEGVADLFAGEHGHGALGEFVHGAHESAAVEVSTDGVHAFEEGEAVVKTCGHVFVDAEVVDLEIG